MDSRAKAGCGLGSAGLAFLVFFLIRAAIRGGHYLSLNLEQNARSTAAAATEEVCTEVGRLQDHVGEYGCWHGIVSGEAWAVPGFDLYYSMLYDQVIVATSKYEFEGQESIRDGDCVHLWGTVRDDADSGVLHIDIDESRPLQVLSEWISC